MSKISAQLSYLVIFNPTLVPPLPTEDEDEIEQAHILFYTSRSRAVSRDTMLRQVGLAKALINFSASVPVVFASERSKIIMLVSSADCLRMRVLAITCIHNRNE
jgi:hypothetical protein